VAKARAAAKPVLRHRRENSVGRTELTAWPNYDLRTSRFQFEPPPVDVSQKKYAQAEARLQKLYGKAVVALNWVGR